MKIKNILFAGCLLIAGLSSCEMKNELLDGEELSGETGILDLNLAVNSTNNVVTKADGDGTTATVDATGFDLLIENSDKSYSKTHTYDPENTEIVLPVGTYSVYAHTPGEATTKAPYYGGKESFEITTGVTQGVEVVCKMENTKFQITFSEELKNNFKNWTVTVTALGVDNFAKSFSGSSDNLVQPDAFYWMLPENVKTIRVNFSGTNNNNETVTDYREYQKPAEADVDYWTGADALAVTISVSTSSDPTGVNGVTIDAEVSWDNTDSTVTVPVEGETTPSEPENPEPSEPSEPGESGDAPTLSGKYLTETVYYDKTGTLPEGVEVTMNVPNKIQNVYVKATTTDETNLGVIFAGMGFMTGDGLDLVTATELSSLFTLPTTEDTEYTFELGGLASFLTVGTHTFTVKVVDQKGGTASGTLKIVVTDSSSEGGE